MGHAGEMRRAYGGGAGLVLLVLGALASSACYSWEGSVCGGRELAHPTMTPADMASAMDRRVRAASEGAAVTLGELDEP